MLSKAIEAAAGYARTTLKDYAKACDLVESMFENEWLLGKELERLFADGTMGHGVGGKRSAKQSGNFSGLSYDDFGVSHKHAALIRTVARTMGQAELLEWVRGKCAVDLRLVAGHLSVAGHGLFTKSWFGRRTSFIPPATFRAPFLWWLRRHEFAELGDDLQLAVVGFECAAKWGRKNVCGGT